MSDQEMLDAIKAAQVKLADAINKALREGLEVQCVVSTADLVSTTAFTKAVRCLPATATRSLS